MAILITAPVTGSLKITNTSASPQSNYLCNLQTAGVTGDALNLAVNITNNNGYNLAYIPLNKLTNVGASGAGSFTLQNAVDAISSLIMK